MEQKKFKTGFWFILGPLLLYWVINYAALFLGETFVLTEFMMKNASLFSEMEELETYMMDHMNDFLALISTKAVELTAFGALATMFLTVTLHVLDVKKAKKANLFCETGKPGILNYSLLLVFSVAVCIALNNLINMAGLALYSDAYQETSETFYSAGFGVQILCLGIIVPIAEEFFYRGIIFYRYRMLGLLAPALMWSTVLFSASHGNMVQMIYAAVLGIALGYVYDKFGTIAAPICVHVVVNMTSLILTKMDGFTWMFGSFERLALTTIGCSFVAACIFVAFQKMESKFPTIIIKKKDPEENLTPDAF